jgi:chromosome segregation ATPase
MKKSVAIFMSASLTGVVVVVVLMLNFVATSGAQNDTNVLPSVITPSPVAQITLLSQDNEQAITDPVEDAARGGAIQAQALENTDRQSEMPSRVQVAQLKQTLATAEANYQTQLNQLQTQLQAAEVTLTQLERERQETQERISTLQQAIQTIDANYQAEVNQNIAQIQAEEAQIQAEIEQLNQQLQVAYTEIAARQAAASAPSPDSDGEVQYGDHPDDEDHEDDGHDDHHNDDEHDDGEDDKDD